MKASKVLFVRQFGPGKGKDQVPCDQFFAYQYANKFQRIKKRLFLKAGLTDQVFDEEFESVNLQQYELIVVQEMFSWNPLYVLRFLRERNRTCKLFYWLRNTLFIEKYGTGITPGNFKDFLNAQRNYIHENKHIDGFGSYGDIMIRDRKMYVAPTPFELTKGTAVLATLIVPDDLEPPPDFFCVGNLFRIEGDKLVSEYSFNLVTNELQIRTIKK